MTAAQQGDEGADRPVLLRIPRMKRGRPHEVRVYVARWFEHLALHVRWFRLSDDGRTYEPTSHGATVPVEFLPELARAVREATEQVARDGGDSPLPAASGPLCRESAR